MLEQYIKCISLGGFFFLNSLTDRYDHSPDDDHIDKITGLTCNPRMKVFASSSIDGTIKIWDEDNRLIR